MAIREFEVEYYSDCNNYGVAVIIKFDDYEGHTDIISVTLMQDGSQVDYEEVEVQKEIVTYLDKQHAQGEETSLESRIELARMV